MQTHLRNQRGGVTLTEVVVCTMLVGLVMVGAMNGVSGVMQTWSAGEQRHDGLALCEQLMAEVLQQPYEEPVDTVTFGRESPEAGTERSAWDDVDDYHGWTSAPEDSSGVSYTGYAGWTRSVTVVLAKLSDPTQTAASDEGLKRITITVTDPSGHSTVLTAFRSKWGTLEASRHATTTLQTLVTDQMNVGGQTLHGATQIQNHAQDDSP